MRVRCWAAMVLFCVSASPSSGASSAHKSSAQTSHAQTPPAQTQSSLPTLSHRAPPPAGSLEGKIKLDVLVTDQTGRPVAGLERTNFTILDNQQPRPLLSFQAYSGSAHSGSAHSGASTSSGGTAKPDPPLEIILLVDMANSTIQRVAFERTQIEGFLRQNGGRLTHPTSLMLFSDQNVKVQPHPSTDGNAMAKALDESETAVHTIPLSRGYDAVDRAALSLKTLHSIAAVEGKKPGRKMLLWIGPGWPMLEGAGYDLSSASRQHLFNNIVDLSRTLREARITLYSLHAFEAGAPDQFYAKRYRDFLKPVLSAKQGNTGDLALPVLAIESGGRAFDTGGDLIAPLNTCFAEGGAYYTLSFDPPQPEHADEYHALQVTIDKPDLRARTSAGYYAEPVPGP